MEIRVLERSIKEASTKYYEGNPIISDERFDALLEHLRYLDPSNDLLTDVGHGYDITKDRSPLKKVAHLYDINKFEAKVRDSSYLSVQPADSVVSPKLDGGSIEAYYTDGILDHVLSRGDGKVGFDVTKNFIHTIPSVLKDKTFSGMVRGEVVVDLEEFNSKWYPDTYKSPRNMATGLSQKLSLSMDERMALRFVAYTVIGKNSSIENDISNKLNVLKWIDSNGFEVVDVFPYEDDSWDDEKLGDLIRGYSKYLVDGVVITSVKSTYDEDKGWSPYRELAYKTASDLAITEVDHIQWSLTRTKKLVPVAHLNPVELSGATIRRATVYNAEFVSNLKIQDGSTVEIRRSGEIIPQIMRVLDNPDKEFSLPSVCPECGHGLEMKGTDLWCVNEFCTGNERDSVLHYLYTIGSVKGLGGSFYTEFVKTFDIRSIRDLYEVLSFTSASNISQIDGMGSTTGVLYEKMKSQLLSDIPFNLFLVSLNIKGLSWKAADKISSYRLDDGSTILGIFTKGSLSHESLLILINQTGINKTVRESLANGGLSRIEVSLSTVLDHANVVEVEDKVEESSTESIKIAFTGKLSVTRKEFESYLEDKGLEQVDIKHAQLLITNTPSGSSSKNKKADSLGIPKVTEESIKGWLDEGKDLVDYLGNLVHL